MCSQHGYDASQVERCCDGLMTAEREILRVELSRASVGPHGRMRVRCAGRALAPSLRMARVRASAREPSEVDDVAHIGTARAARPAQRDHQFYTRLNDAPVAHLRVVASQIRRDAREHGAPHRRPSCTGQRSLRTDHLARSSTSCRCASGRRTREGTVASAALRLRTTVATTAAMAKLVQHSSSRNAAGSAAAANCHVSGITCAWSPQD
eukprot:CAMPEP_0119423370 /NCGR_PEP_ID=MMETSP1335-20130426/30141_1 /TAXON_ID=259385 /ORGANISM="Chrysoculter rhomboideus, Strain RCC1486" /LENGTH=208 /DNA_ID=CAMNT_0007448859 /DNA_START=557 /DNA_END=1183 /DNA_ORIENTATION=+